MDTTMPKDKPMPPQSGDGLLDAIPSGIIVLDGNGRISMANQAASKLSGWAMHELVGGNFHQILNHSRRDGTERPEAESPLVLTQNDGQERRVDDDVFWRSDGMPFPVHYVVSRLNRAGDPEGTVLVFEDVTREKRASDEIKLALVKAKVAQDRLNDVVNTITDGFALWDSNDRLWLFNDRFLELNAPIRDQIRYGLPFEKFASLAFSEGVFAEDGGTDHPSYEEMVEDHQRTGITREYRLRDGRWVRLTDRRTMEGGCVGIRTEITEEKARDQALEESSELLNQIQAIANAGTWAIDLDTGEAMFSAETRRLIGAPPTEAASLETLIEHIFPPDQDYVRKVLSEDREWDAPFDWEFRTGIAETRFLRARAAMKRCSDGRSRRLLGMMIDVTEEKLREEQLQSIVDELSRSNAELKRFAFVASHDLQEPIRSISLYSQILERSLGDRLDRTDRENLDFITSSAKRLRALVGDLLRFAQVNHGDKAFDWIESASSLGMALKNLEAQIFSTEASIDAGVLPSVVGDESQLTAVFQNLISNGIKFSRPGVPPRISVTADEEDNTWVFTVADNGIGIEAKYLDGIFEVFKRLHTIQAYPGTGIGLPICKRIVERHGGRMWAESAVGRGTTFRFTLPMP